MKSLLHVPLGIRSRFHLESASDYVCNLLQIPLRIFFRFRLQSAPDCVWNLLQISSRICFRFLLQYAPDFTWNLFYITSRICCRFPDFREESPPDFSKECLFFHLKLLQVFIEKFHHEIIQRFFSKTFSRTSIVPSGIFQKFHYKILHRFNLQFFYPELYQ